VLHHQLGEQAGALGFEGVQLHGAFAVAVLEPVAAQV
jgi:hypothetical protein